jgi:hypothetical protein
LTYKHQQIHNEIISLEGVAIFDLIPETFCIGVF